MVTEEDWKEIDARLEEFHKAVLRHRKVMDGVTKRLKQMIEDAHIAIDGDERSIIQCEDALFNHENRIAQLETQNGIRSKPMTLREKNTHTYGK